MLNDTQVISIKFTMKISLNFLSTFILFFLFTNVSNATVFTSVGIGAFHDPNIWDVGNGRIPGEFDDVVIHHEVDLNLNSKVTIKSLSISNAAIDFSGFDIYGTDTLVVMNDVSSTLFDYDKQVYLRIGQQATVMIGGNCHFLRIERNTSDKFLNFSLEDESKTFIKGDFRFDYLGAGSDETIKEIKLDNNSLLEVEGTTTFINSAGNDFNLVMFYNAEAIFRDSLILILNGTGREAGITLHDTTSLQILSSAYIFNSSTASNDFAKLRVRDNASRLYIQENVYMESVGARVKLEAEGGGGKITVGGDIIMNASGEDEASINIIDDGEIYLGGEIIRQNNFGKLTMKHNGTLVFNGSDRQIMPEGNLPNSGSDSLYFKNVRLENTAGEAFVLSENMIVKDDLVLTNGNLKTDSTAMIILKDSATISGSSTAYVEGPIKKIGTTGGQDITFPVGTKTTYAPITISAISDQLSEVTVQYLSEPPPFGAEIFESTINNVSTDGHWMVEKNINTGDLNLTLTWEDSAEAGINEIDDLVVAGWDGTEWKNYGQQSAGMIGAGGFVSNSLSEPPPFGAEIFTLASTSSLNSLPVELQMFKAMPRSGSVDLEWHTESEINFSHFLVERSADGRIYQAIQYVKSTGGATTPARYTFEDLSPYADWNYYRLRMEDQDGSFEYSPVEVVKSKENTSIIVYPNPVVDVLYIQDAESQEGVVSVEIFDQNSSKLLEEVIRLDNGPVQLAKENIQSLPSGFYIVKITGKSRSQFFNFVIAE